MEKTLFIRNEENINMKYVCKILEFEKFLNTYITQIGNIHIHFCIEGVGESSKTATRFDFA